MIDRFKSPIKYIPVCINLMLMTFDHIIQYEGGENAPYGLYILLSASPTATIGVPDWFPIAQSVTYRGAIVIPLGLGL